MSSDTITIFVNTSDAKHPDNTRNALPNLHEMLVSASAKPIQVELSVVNKSLIEALESLSTLISTIKNLNANQVPKRILFTLGIDSEGTVGIISMASASLNYSASITAEFEI